MVCIQAGSGIRPQANRPPGGFRRAPPAVGRLRRPGLRPARPSNSTHFPADGLLPSSPKGACPRQGSRKGRHTAAGQPPSGRFPAGSARRRPPAAAGPAARPPLKFHSFPGRRSAPLIPKGRLSSAGEQKGQAYGRRPTALRAVSGGLRPPSAACGGRACGPLRSPQIPLVSRQTVRPPRPEREKHPPARMLTGPGAHTPRHRRAIARSDS